MRSSALLLWLCSSLALARDPFQPLAATLCQTQVAAPEGWRLQGILARRRTTWRGWCHLKAKAIGWIIKRLFPSRPGKSCSLRRACWC